MIRETVVLLLIVYSITSISSCMQDGPLETFLEKAKANLDPALIRQFKNAPIDSIMPFAYANLDSTLRERVFNDTLLVSRLKDYLKENHIPLLYQDRYLMISFHTFLDNKEINRKEILRLCKLDYDRYRLVDEALYIEEAMHTNWIALHNFNYLNNRDTLSIELPLMKFGALCRAEYGNGFLTDNNYNNGDSVYIKGVLLEKNFETAIHDYYIYYPIVFKLRILQCDKETYFYSDTVKPGSKVSLDLFRYNRVIRKAK